ncbi:hypothetical protein E7744_05370 [Citricoccus sp. SGAir0253]|uniref:hypothetical protein n=1 Tax=Citricoccus sp. SGAir0253 TaxID=2567881 RepID=UPI0010CD1F7C|nr:hypothetical protein [Citricoccus sp. SGAir0253]QCU77689.1 hypothetical protein E7744_05370 [Citricoccus sp. SGAir0253]
MTPRTRRRRRALGVLLVCALLVAGGFWAASRFIDGSEILVRERCTAVVGPDSFDLAPDQAANAALIAAVSLDRGLPARAASIGIATAVQESKLRNIDYGDEAGPDSRGLFQQRPTQGWGSEEQVMDPVYAANRFYQELERLVPDFEQVDITVAAQAVQRSAYPDAYADHEPEGRAYASALTGHSPAALNCVLKAPDAPGDAEALVAALEDQLSAVEPSVSRDGRTVTIPATGTRGWALVQWAVAHADRFGVTAASFGGQGWVRADHGWAPATGTDGAVTITLAG